MRQEGDRRLIGERQTIYIKAYPLKNLSELEKVKMDIDNNNIVILRVTPLSKNPEELRTAISELIEFSTSLGGDIARLGEDRIIITPPNVKISRGTQKIFT